jgi:hypothetical protein
LSLATIFRRLGPRAIAIAAVLSCSLLLCSCAFMRLNINTDDPLRNVSGVGVAGAIDLRYDPLLRSYDPSLRPDPATCPEHLDLSHGPAAGCVVPVSGLRLPILVSPNAQRDGMTFSSKTALFSMRIVERSTASTTLTDFGLRGTIDCGGPRVRVYTVGDRFRCVGHGKDVPSTIAFVVTSLTGGLASPTFAGRETTIGALLKPYMRGKPPGSSTTVPGDVLEKVVHNAFARQMGLQLSSALHPKEPRCPTTSDLSHGHRVRCSIDTANGSILYDTSIDAGTINVRLYRAIGLTKPIRLDAEQYYEHQLEAKGISRPVDVNCGKDRALFIMRDTKILCTINGGSETRSLTISFPHFPSREVLYDVEPL